MITPKLTINEPPLQDDFQINSSPPRFALPSLSTTRQEECAHSSKLFVSELPTMTSICVWFARRVSMAARATQKNSSAKTKRMADRRWANPFNEPLLHANCPEIPQLIFAILIQLRCGAFNLMTLVDWYVPKIFPTHPCHFPSNRFLSWLRNLKCRGIWWRRINFGISADLARGALRFTSFFSFINRQIPRPLRIA